MRIVLLFICCFNDITGKAADTICDKILCSLVTYFALPGPKLSAVGKKWRGADIFRPCYFLHTRLFSLLKRNFRGLIFPEIRRQILLKITLFDGTNL